MLSSMNLNQLKYTSTTPSKLPIFLSQNHQIARAAIKQWQQRGDDDHCHHITHPMARKIAAQQLNRHQPSSSLSCLVLFAFSSCNLTMMSIQLLFIHCR